MLCQARSLQPDVISGCGVADLKQGLEVSFVPGGDEALTAYRLELWSAEAETLLYSTGDAPFSSPVLPLDAAGEPQRITVRIPAAALAGAGACNGQDLRLVLTQITARDRLTNSLPAFFHARTAPVIRLKDLPPVVTSHSALFTAVYTQPEGDALQRVRWTLATAEDLDRPIRDSGWVPASGEAQFRFEGFCHGQSYLLRCRALSQLGAQADTGWQPFRCQWAVPPVTAPLCTLPQQRTGLNLAAARLLESCKGGSDEQTRIGGGLSTVSLSSGAIKIHWPDLSPAAAFLVLRQHAGEAFLRPAARLSPRCAGFTDWAVPCGTQVSYVVLALGREDQPLAALQSAPVTARGWGWQLLRARPAGPGAWQPVEEFRFACGLGGVRLGRFSNRSSPTLQPNFTPYPTLQRDGTNALSGTLTALAGGSFSALQQSSLTRPLPDLTAALCTLSTTEDALFLRDPKGRLLPVVLSGPVSFEEEAKSAALPQTVSLPWQQCGTADALALYIPGPTELIPADGILFASLQLDFASGHLLLDLPDLGPATGLRLRQDGVLCAVPGEEPYLPASLQLRNGRLLAEWEAPADSGGGPQP